MYVAQNSRQAYQRLLPELSRREQEVFDIIDQWGPITNRRIGQLMGVDVCSVTGRTNKLVEKGLVFEHHTGKCSITGYNASFWCAVKETLF